MYTYSEQDLCQGVTKAGKPCHARFTDGGYCHQHNPETIKARKAKASVDTQKSSKKAAKKRVSRKAKPTKPVVDTRKPSKKTRKAVSRKAKPTKPVMASEFNATGVDKRKRQALNRKLAADGWTWNAANFHEVTEGRRGRLCVYVHKTGAKMIIKRSGKRSSQTWEARMVK